MIIYQNATDHAGRNSELCTFSIENMWLSYEEIIQECAAGKYKQKHYHMGVWGSSSIKMYLWIIDVFSF